MAARLEPPQQSCSPGSTAEDSDQLSSPPFCPVSTPEGWLVRKALGERVQLGKKGTKRNLRGGVRNRLGLSQPVTHQNPSQREQLASHSPPKCSLSSHRAPPPLSLPLSASLSAHTHNHSGTNTCSHMHTQAQISHSLLPPAPCPHCLN